MAINRDGEDDGTDEVDGKTFRQKFEKLQAENRTLKAEKLLQAGTYTLVKPEDLTRTDPDKLEEVAQTLQAEREEASKALVRTQFAKRGLEGEALDEAVEGFFGTEEGGGAIDRVTELAATGGSRPPLHQTKLTGVAAIEAGLAANAKRKTKSTL